MSKSDSFFKKSYQKVLKPIFFRIDPEKIHDRITFLGQTLGRTRLGRGITRQAFNYQDAALSQDLAGIHFPNPIGLAAGFDKDARLTEILAEVGFGFEEIGSITGEPCLGNARPRLWRLPKSQGLVVNYGLKNAGAVKISARLKDKSFRFPVGISCAKTNSPSTVETNAGVADYLKVVEAFQGIGDYYTLNLSCPNAYGGLPFCEPVKLKQLLEAVFATKPDKPVFLKLSPDITQKELDQTIELAISLGVAGLISSNLTKSRQNSAIKDGKVPESGGLSGKIVEDLANQQLAYIYQKSKGQLILVGCGGVFSASDAYRKIKLGASLVQLVTGMIYEGPQLIGQINRGLVDLLKKDGYSNISEAIGVDNPIKIKPQKK